MLIIAIDGASRRNGKPDCLSTGSVFAMSTTEDFFKLYVDHERGSTNQRGELKALLKGLDVGKDHDDVYFITDSEYIFNSVNKGWYKNWRIKGWITGNGDPVKNRDMWEEAGALLDHYEETEIDLVCYHIKGHLLSMGKVTASKILDKDKSGQLLFDTLVGKWDDFLERGNADTIEHALALFERNHGFRPDLSTFGKMVVCNTVADLAAGYYADIKDSKS